MPVTDIKPFAYFLAGAATGTVLLGSRAMLSWPGAGFLAFVAGVFAWDAVRGRGSWRSPLGLAAVAAVAAYGGYSATKPMRSFLGFSLDVPSPGLMLLAGLIGFMGVMMLLTGLFFPARGRDPIDNPVTSMGLDIVGAFGIAAALAIAGQLLL